VGWWADGRIATQVDSRLATGFIDQSAKFSLLLTTDYLPAGLLTCPPADLPTAHLAICRPAHLPTA